MTVKAPKTGDKSPSINTKVSTTAHLLQTAGHHLGHAKVHFNKVDASKTPKEKALNLEHGMTHLNGGIEHIQKEIDHIKANYPAEGGELNRLEQEIPTGVKGRIHVAVQNHKGQK